MASSNNSLVAKSKLSSASPSLKITPSNSPVLKPTTRSPFKHSPYQSSLSLQTVIGTTTSDPNGFSYHESSRSFALCAGSSAILAEFDEQLNLSQRFFRARPTATGLNAAQTSSYNSSTPPSTPDSRTKAIQPPTRQGQNGSLYASSPIAEGGDTPTSRTWSSRERIKAVTSVSLSPNGRFLAVGETGYNPRVLIYSTAKDSPPDSPLSIMTEHTSGVRGLAFSPNSQFLASLGDIHDGFLFVSAVNLRSGSTKLHSTNKCTSFVRDMCWMGQTLVTVGTRHIKVWRFSDTAAGSSNPAPNALSGRNCLLGRLVDCVFTCIASISDKECITCTDTGLVCILDDTGAQQKLHLVKSFDFGVNSVSVDAGSGDVWFGGRDRAFRKCPVEQLRGEVYRDSSPPRSPLLQASRSKAVAIVSMGIISAQMITVDSTRAIRVCSLEKLEDGHIEDQADVSMPAHKDAVLGLGPLGSSNAYSADFFTWSCYGAVSFWDLQGKCKATKKIELEQPSRNDDDANELKILRAIEDMGVFVSGDRYGVLRVIKGETWRCTNELRAHGAEVTDIATQQSATICLVASAGRDRMIQLFRCTEDRLELIQTMDEHVGAVGRILFVNNGERLLSCSADRTVIIRERMVRTEEGEDLPAFVLAKVITLKASPVSMAVLPEDPDGLVLSTIDRQVHKFDTPSARHIHSFRAGDPETNDTAVMGSLTMASGTPGQCPRLLIGVSTTDKSIRVYDFERDVLLTREFGHTEGVSDVMMLQTDCSGSPTKGVKKTLVSTGLDGVVMTWNLAVEHFQSPPEAPQPAADETPGKELTATKPPLRRILSRTELAGFVKPLDTPSPSTPSAVRDPSPPRIRKRTSRTSLGGHLLKSAHDSSPPPVPTPPVPRRRSPTSPSQPAGRKGRENRSPSPPSPKVSAPPRSITKRSSTTNFRRGSIDSRARSSKVGGACSATTTTPNGNSNNSEFGSLNMSTEQVCRTLRAYRKKLSGSSDAINTARELERELDLTSRALSERNTKWTQSSDSQENNASSNKYKGATASSTSKTKRLTKRIPSTPNLRQARKERVHRANSLDGSGEK